MNRPRSLLFTLSCLLAAPLVAQSQIGGGICNALTLSGNYAFTLTGSQILPGTGYFQSAFQGIGSANFDGQSKVTITMTTDTLPSATTPLTWAGTYSIDARCAGVITITSGGSATLNLALYNQGASFQAAGNDAIYNYTGTGDTQRSGCSPSTLSGGYSFDGGGYRLIGAFVHGAASAGGSLQFDGVGTATVHLNYNFNRTTAGTLALTGPYSISSNCLGSATLTDSTKANTNTYIMTFSVASAEASGFFYATLSQSGNLLISGKGHAISGGCSASNLRGRYSVDAGFFAISPATGTFTSYRQVIGTMTFDGNGGVTMISYNAQPPLLGYNIMSAGTYTVQPDCSVVGHLQGTESSMFVWDFEIDVGEPFSTVSQSGTEIQPVCATPTLSGEYTYTASGFTLTGTQLYISRVEGGVFQFDGQGNMTASYTVTSSGAPSVPHTATGTYSVTASCLASATLFDDLTGVSDTVILGIGGAYGQDFSLIETNTQLFRAGVAHSAFLNPSQSIANAASYAINATPAGSVFAVFGTGLAPAGKSAQASDTPLPTSLLSTKVTVNGEPAPLFYVDSGQIDAQMPWDILGGAVASVIVTNGTAASNAAAVFVPATATPGISVYGNDRAVVVNANGSTNSASAGANAGDEVVAYFTGGGPVQDPGLQVTGAPAPSGPSAVASASPIVTVGGINATVIYIGLTPGSIGLYQANFLVPQIAQGTYPVVISIGGQASNTLGGPDPNPVMTVSD